MIHLKVPIRSCLHIPLYNPRLRTKLKSLLLVELIGKYLSSVHNFPAFKYFDRVGNFSSSPPNTAIGHWVQRLHTFILPRHNADNCKSHSTNMQVNNSYRALSAKRLHNYYTFLLLPRTVGNYYKSHSHSHTNDDCNHNTNCIKRTCLKDCRRLSAKEETSSNLSYSTQISKFIMLHTKAIWEVWALPYTTLK